MRNLAGSVWPGPARLVEETTIGSDAGQEPYLFGRVRSIAANDDRILVLDGGIDLVRAYSSVGEHLLDIGRRGPGPGEFVDPRFVELDGSGRIYVQARGEIEVFRPDGSPFGTWTVHDGRLANNGPFELTVDDAGTAYVAEVLRRADDDPWIERYALNTYQDGQRGTATELGSADRISADLVLEFAESGSWAKLPVPFVPRTLSAISHAGTLLVGESDDYSFTVRRRDGAALEIRKYWDPTTVAPDEYEWNIERLRTFVARADRTHGWDVATELPRHKPAFARFVVDRDERIWVFRAEKGRTVECDSPADSHPCWRDTYLADVFDAEGIYLGEVTLPEEFLNRATPFHPRPEIRGNSFVVLVEDEMGIEYIKRYRLEIPTVAENE